MLPQHGTNILRNSSNDHRKSGLEHFAINIDGDKGDLKKLRDHFKLNDITVDKDINDSDKQHNSSFKYTIRMG